MIINDMEDKREEDFSPAPGLEDQQMSPEVSALSRTPTPASICPVPSPVQRPIRIHQQRSHRKFLLAIPAITVLAVAAVVLFYAITWNDSPPSNRNDEVHQIKDEELNKRASGRSDFDTEESPNHRATKPKKPIKKPSEFTPTNEKAIGDSNENVYEGPLLREMPSGKKNEIFETEQMLTSTDKIEQDLGAIPWPSYTDANFTDDDLYAEEMLFKVDKLVLKKNTKQPFFIDLVESKLNFTDANDYCTNRGGYLLQLFSVPEEQYFTRVLTHSELFHSRQCDSGFIGVRQIISEDIKVKGVKVATFANPLSSPEIWIANNTASLKDDDCIVLYSNSTTKAFGLIRKPCNALLHCYLCETAKGCPSSSCYFWHYKMNKTVSYNDAKKLCVSEKDARLARIRNKATLKMLKEYLNITQPNSLFNLYSENACSQGYFVEKEELGLGEMGFENVDEKQISYKSPALTAMNTLSGKHCVSVSRELGFRWVSVSCTDPKCFFCRYDRF